MRIIIAVLAVIVVALAIWLIIDWTSEDTADLSVETPNGEVSVDVDNGD